MNSAETLFEAVAAKDWEEALVLVHQVRDRDDQVVTEARRVFLEAVDAQLSSDGGGLSNHDLEKLLLLQKAGSLRVPEPLQDRLAEALVLRNREQPHRALQFARYRPEVEVCRAVIAQYQAPEGEHDHDALGRTTQVNGHQRPDARRSVFRSAQERVLYNAATRLFPRMVALPNAAIHAMVEFEAVRGFLDASARDYFFRGLVDLAIVDPRDGFKAVWFFELDSPWHDAAEATERDRIKERILTLAGCRLTRIRTTGETDLSAMVALLERATA